MILDTILQELIEKGDSREILSFLVSEAYAQDILDLKKQLSNKKPGFSLDIDETLSRTIVAWFEQMLILFGNPENLSPLEMAEKYRLTQNVPYFQNNPEIQQWMHEKREDNDFQKTIPLIEDSNTIYTRIHDAHIEISLYITARPESVREGTIEWLRKHHFPEAGILLRPTSLDHSYSNIWKASILDILYPEIQWIVDDNPGLISSLPRDYPGMIFAYSHSENFWKKNVINCLSHNDVISQICRYFNK